MIQMRAPQMPYKLLFSHQALQPDQQEEEVEVVSQKEVTKILLVDPHEICIKLLNSSFKLIFPHATIATASTAAEALSLVKKHGPSDIVIVEERLRRNNYNAATGSMLLQCLTANCPKALYIGLSAYIKEDKQCLKNGGADFVWAKPPPTMTEALRNKLLGALLEKRGKSELSKKILA
jgi:CheY-like chemotaxis protein